MGEKGLFCEGVLLYFLCWFLRLFVGFALCFGLGLRLWLGFGLVLVRCWVGKGWQDEDVSGGKGGEGLVDEGGDWKGGVEDEEAAI